MIIKHFEKLEKYAKKFSEFAKTRKKDPFKIWILTHRCLIVPLQDPKRKKNLGY